MLASDDVIFAWAIGKSLLIVIVCFGTLVYLAWAVTYKKEIATHVGISEDSTLKYGSSVKRQVLPIENGTTWTPVEEVNVHEPSRLLKQSLRR